MSQISTLSKVVIGASLVAATAGVAYYLFRKEEETVVASSSSAPTESKDDCPMKLEVSNITVEQLLSIMDKIIDSQNVMKGVMKKITEEINSNEMTFAQAYARVKELQPNDPMEQTGLSMNEFDELLDKYQEDPRILDAISKIMGPSDDELVEDDGRVLTVKELIDVHQYMLDQLKGIVSEIKSKKSIATLDPRTMTVTAQVLVGARVENQFKIGSPAVERSVMQHQAQLATNHQFATINMMMQQAMTELMGDQVMSRE
jgi:hypothetical protein